MKAICRISKCKSSGSATGKTQHNYREREVLNADKERQHLNQEYINLTQRSIWDIATERIEEAGVTRKIKPDAVRAVEMILTASADFFERDESGVALDIREGEWLKKNQAFLAERYGKNVVALTLHQDEKTPHLHAIIVPITSDNRLSAKEVFTPRTLRALQTDYAQAMQGFGLERGIEGSKAKHSDMKTYYGAVKSLSKLDEDLKEAQEIKATLPTLKQESINLQKQLQFEREQFEKEKQAAKQEREAMEKEMGKMKFNYEFTKQALAAAEHKLAETKQRQNRPQTGIR
ncbi:MAG: MobV family relaxase [Emticicia sp.]|nr:MobV family relaxase [Emticicia sp.]